MPININTNIKINASFPSESKYLNSNIAYADEAEVILLLPISLRHLGLTVLLADGNEYWFKDGVSDVDLVLKTSAGSGNFLPTTGGTMTGDINMEYNNIISSGASISVASGFLNDIDGLPAVNWDGRNVIDDNAYVSLDWQNRVLNDLSGYTSLNYQNRELRDALGVRTANYDSGYLENNSQITVAWKDRFLADSDNTVSVDWENKILKNGGIDVVTWSDGQLKANYTPTGSTDLATVGYVNSILTGTAEIFSGTVTSVSGSSLFNITTNTTTPFIQFANQTQGLILASPTGSTGQPTFRQGVISDINNLQSSLNNKQGVLSGTGLVRSSGGTITYDNSNYLTTLNSWTVTGNTGSGLRLGTTSADSWDIIQSNNTRVTFNPTNTTLFRGGTTETINFSIASVNVLTFGYSGISQILPQNSSTSGTISGLSMASGGIGWSPASGTSQFHAINLAAVSINQSGGTGVSSYINLGTGGNVTGVFSAIRSIVSSASNKFFINHTGTAVSVHLGAFSIGSVSSPNASAVLQLTSAANNTGFGNVVMNTAQRDAIVSPIAGLQVITTDVTKSLSFYDGSRWKSGNARIYNSSVQTNNAAANAETDTYSYNMPLNTMSADNDIINFSSSHTANPGANSRVRHYFNAILIGDTTAINVAAGATIEANTTIIRTSNTSVRCFSVMTTTKPSGVNERYTSVTNITGLTGLSTTAYIIKSTCNSANLNEVISNYGVANIEYGI